MSSRAWRLLAGLLLAAALLFIFFRGLDLSALGAALRTAHRGLLLAVAALTLLTYAARSWRWGWLLAPLGRVPFVDLYSATMVGFMTGLVVPRAGEIVRPFLIARRHPIPASAGFASIILERLVDLITMLLLFFAYLYLLPVPPQQTTGPLLGALRAGGALAGAGAVAVLAVLFLWHRHAEAVMRVVDRVLAWGPRRIAGVASRLVRSFGEGLGVLRASPAHLLAIFAQSLAVWLLLALGVYWNNLAFGIDLPYHSAFLILAFLTVGVAVPTPGMVGGFHEAYLLALTRAYGVDKDTAAAAGIACHALTNLPVLLLGLALLGREGLSFGKVAHMGDER